MREKSWEVPNQEWVLMYRHGLNQARIARLVGAPVSKVGYHLTVARRLDPSLTIEHEALARKLPKRVHATSIDTMNKLIAFVKNTGRYPSLASTSDGERKLAMWLQRRRHDSTTDSLAQVFREGLQVLPGWETKTRSSMAESKWQERLAALADFRAKGEDWPRHKKTDSKEEHALGVWLHAQRSKHASGVLAEPHAAALDTYLPGWREGRRRGRKPSK